jgi:hypothetical protein
MHLEDFLEVVEQSLETPAAPEKIEVRCRSAASQ